jgi:signal transduction histidine kinase
MRRPATAKQLLTCKDTAERTDSRWIQALVTGDVWVHGSRTQLIRLLSNLVSNARRHAETGVTVCVTSADGQAVVAVTDDGAGIEPADRERVFERFVRLEDGHRRDAAGSGLGLAISRDIAHAHRGTLRIEDSARGARFVLRLPLMEGKRSAGGRHASSQADR